MNSTTMVAALVVLLALAAGLAIGYVAGQRSATQDGAALRDELRALSAQAVAESSRQVIDLADSRVRATEQVVAPVKESLSALDERLRQLTTNNASWQAELRQQVESVRVSGVELRQQTQALADALRKPQVRGSWGELQLRRSLELAGLLKHCSFTEQVSRTSEDGVIRPDVVVNIAGDKSIVLDSKVPLEAFLTATHATDSTVQAAELERHARQVRSHIDSLSSKAYWHQFSPAPEFVVMFMPGEAIFSQALETDPTLIEYAAKRNVMLATPTTLIAMLKTVSYAWTQDALADNAREVHQLGKELYTRLCSMGDNLDKLGRSIASVVGCYNKTLGAIETRVLVSARRMRDLEVSDDELIAPHALTDLPRPLTAPELLADPPPSAGVASLIEGEPGREQWASRAAGA